MSLDHFMNDVAYSGVEVPSQDALKDLSGIDRNDARRFFAWTQDWDAQRMLDTIRKLGAVAAADPSIEFDTVFKAGLMHSKPEIRDECIRQLHGSADADFAAKLADLLAHDDCEAVRCRAAEALAGFSELASDGRLSASRCVLVVDALSASVKSGSPRVKGKALISLAGMPHHDASGLISSTFESSSGDDAMRVDAITAMGKSSDPCWLDDVRGEFDSRSDAVRAAAVRAFGMIAEDEDVWMLDEPLDDYALSVQLAGIEALRLLGGDKARAMLNRRLSSSSEPSVREAAKRSLGVLHAEDELRYAVSPEMLERGLYGAPIGLRGDERDVARYDAPTQEGWARITSDGSEVDVAPNTDDIGEDMEDYLESEEFFRSSNS